MQVVRVSGASRPKSVAGAIVAMMKDVGQVEVQAVGAGAVNQAVKAIAVARGYLQEDAKDLIARPEFIEVTIDGTTKTGIRFWVEMCTEHQ
ncbi:MAG: stage V sporulation protein S [Sulfobacillus sp.]|nr:stage V sporulation protein S [Sulfobacillus sp.]